MKKLKKKQLIMAMMFRIVNLWQPLAGKALDELTLRQYMLLMAMRSFPENSMNLSMLAETFGGTRQNVRQLLTSLAEKEYVRFTPPETDKRELRVSLTEKAFAFFRDHEEHDELFDPAFDGIGEKTLDAAIECLEQILKNIGGNTIDI